MQHSRHEIDVDFNFHPGQDRNPNNKPPLMLHQEVTMQKLHGEESVPTSRLSASQESLKFS